MPTCSGMKDYVMNQGSQSRSAASPRLCPLLPPAPTSPPAAPAHDSSEMWAAEDEEESWFQQQARTLLGEAAFTAEPRSPPASTCARLTDSWRFVNYVQHRMKIAPEEVHPALARYAAACARCMAGLPHARSRTMFKERRGERTACAQHLTRHGCMCSSSQQHMVGGKQRAEAHE